MKYKYKDPTDKNEWTEWRRSNYDFFEKRLQGIDSSKILLDLGSGEGHFRKLFERFVKVIRVDFQKYDGIDVVADLTQSFPFEDNYADVVILSNVLEHIPYPNFFLGECYRILKEGGRIIGTVPFLVKIHQKPYDYNRYTYFMLEKLLKDCSFSDIEITELGSFLDVYRGNQARFFQSLFKTRFCENYFLHRLLYTISQFAWFLNRIIFRIFMPVYKLAKSDQSMAEGYGFTTIKSNPGQIFTGK